MTESKRLNLILGTVAVAVLLFSFTAYAYIQIPKGNPDVLVVNGTEYSWETIFFDFDAVAFIAIREEHVGIPLEALILDSGVQEPETHTYKFKGLDGYTGQKDFTWDDIQSGYLIEEQHRAVFPDYAQSFWVRDLAYIEVI